jgi:3,4-dihydroxy-2-butanone 4-phosphate synthase
MMVRKIDNAKGHEELPLDTHSIVEYHRINVICTMMNDSMLDSLLNTVMFLRVSSNNRLLCVELDTMQLELMLDQCLRHATYVVVYRMWLDFQIYMHSVCQ